MSAVFADTFYFLGLTNPGDHAHQKCLRFSGQFEGTVVTSTPVLLELADALAQPPHRIVADTFIRSLPAQPGVKIVPLTQSLFDRGLVLYSRHRDKEWSLTDCISFVVMRDEGVTEAVTGDHHFEQAGFVALLK